MSKKPFQFVTTCEDSNVVGSHGQDIDEMLSSIHCVDIPVEDFLNKYRDEINVEEMLSMFNQETEEGLIGDWALNFYESKFQGIECVFVQYSKIEHIYVRENDLSKVLSGDDADMRRHIMEELENSLDEREDWNDAKGKDACLKALSAFVKENKDTMDEYRITLGSLFQYQVPEIEFVKIADKSFFPTEQEVSPELSA